MTYASYSTLYSNQLRESFEYLETEFEYRYQPAEFCYSKGLVKIYITFEPHFVVIQYWLISEPGFTKLPITLLLELSNEKTFPEVHDKASVEETIKIHALFYKSKIDKIAQRLPSLLLPAIKKSFENALAITKWPLETLLKADDFPLIFDYIKSKDQTWMSNFS